MNYTWFVFGAIAFIFCWKRCRIREQERGLLWKNGEFAGALSKGTHWFFQPLSRARVQVLSALTPWITHPDLAAMIKSGRLAGTLVEVLELSSHQVALVTLDKRFAGILPAGKWAWWKGLVDVQVSVWDIRENNSRLTPPNLDAIMELPEVLRCIHAVTGEHEHHLSFYRVRAQERGLLWKNKEFAGILGEGVYCFFDPIGAIKVEVLSRLTPWIRHDQLPAMIKSGRLTGPDVEVLELATHQRGLAWLDTRFSGILPPGRAAWWKGMIDVRIEVRDIGADNSRFTHPELDAILAMADGGKSLEAVDVPPGSSVAFYRHGAFAGLLEPGRHAFWKSEGGNGFHPVDLREQTLDIGGQDMLTADKLALRLNVSLSYRVDDVLKSLTAATDVRQSLYREAQLLLRARVGERELDALLADKDAMSGDLENAIRERAVQYGLVVTSFGVRDIILPGDIKALMNKVVEAKKASEAATIVRREETAAMRHQLNSAKLLADNPTLMRLKELETLEKVVSGGKFKVILGEQGLAEKVTKLI